MIHTAMNMVDHSHCLALSGCFRGKLCEQLMNRPGQRVPKGSRIYGLGDAAQSVFFREASAELLLQAAEQGGPCFDTLVVDEVAGVPEMITFFNIHGAMVYVDEQGRNTGYEDVFTKIAMCRAHYAACGLGADYVTQFVR